MLKCRIMQNAQSIYQQTIVRLPSSEKLRLAMLILRDLSEENVAAEKTSALEFLANLPDVRVFDSAEEVDRHLTTERESWDN